MTRITEPFLVFGRVLPTNSLKLINIERLIDDFKNLQDKY
ncbi:hypothetical protein THZG08_70088 [Vibrio owensii]|nr:hypothetical protein THZG08_70088 [Vibrio owensii]CAH1590611.1 hypothetical protein THOA03_70089 [Vibrio owensii]